MITPTYRSISKAPGMFKAIFVHYLHYGLHNNHVIQVQMYEMDIAVADSTLGPNCHPADERQGQVWTQALGTPRAALPAAAWCSLSALVMYLSVCPSFPYVSLRLKTPTNQKNMFILLLCTESAQCSG